ncbi:START-like domain-containing protein [Hymenobacter sp. GOD-10R]|uniref:START-like domain-containing protein n=1 Tax=Hymenobacter sp. GOD-10R TaxID=3093922 RepID=UPI002D790337|nr:START-like domain-containing protein [Hymenobacter sp. GOD-10R]WRQ26245.1 START-like domain-containing protein [Hymenobacter sp. GOD-10R]
MPLSATRTKHRFMVEYPVNASPKILYPYLASPSGLGQWFCQEVRLEENQRYNFIWDNQSHFAELNSHRTNRSVRFVFLDQDKRPMTDANYLDFTIEESQLTQEVFLRVLDYSEETDDIELQEMWDGLVQQLRELVGG